MTLKSMNLINGKRNVTNVPLLVLMTGEELVELLAPELEFVLGVLLHCLLVGDRVVVGGQEGLE